MVRGTLVAMVAGLLMLGAWRTAHSKPNRLLSIGSTNPRQPYCSGEYADDMSVLSAKAHEFEQKPESQYTHCVRTTAVYECISYGADGNLRRVRRKVTAHGTAFAYKQGTGETFLLTNDHVAEWPAVTDDEHKEEDIPSGCKRVSDSLRIVDNESDAYERDDIPLTRVATDPQLDMAVLRAHATLPIIPWKIGRSAALRERNTVDVRGFPLGAFKATTAGKVISAYDHDDDRDWDHDDFVIDALLSPGNSGSPVLAISCKTGEPELVGIYHAGYTNGSALNVVVGIDQVRDLMTTMKRTPHAAKLAENGALDAKARARLQDGIKSHQEGFFAFGNLTAMAHSRSDGAVVFEVMSREFPVKVHAIMAVEDLLATSPEDFGKLGRTWFGNRAGFKSVGKSDLDGEGQAQLNHLLDSLRRSALMSFDYRTAARKANGSREQFDHLARMERSMKRSAAAQQDLASTVNDWADRFGPHGTDPATPLAELFQPLGVSPPSAAVTPP